MKKERKSNLLTVRLTDEEKSALDSLTGHMDKSKSDVMLRACKFFVSLGGDKLGGSLAGKGTDEREKMKHRVHVRVADSDMETLRTHSDSSGDTVSQLIRKAIKAFADGLGISY